jgi:hypothetical protein
MVIFQSQDPVQFDLMGHPYNMSMFPKIFDDIFLSKLYE